MPEIIPTNQEVLSFRGLHLYHYGMSNCSQRVRMVLEEKGLPWTSHHLDLARNEHATPAYQGINPNGVVPTLVHDGKVIIESVDIISYLDQTFPEPPLMPDTQEGRRIVKGHLENAAAVQGAVKILSHEFLFKPTRYLRARQFGDFSRAHQNKALVDFHRKFSSKDGLEKAEISSAISEMHDALAGLEHALDSQRWLVGEVLSLADIAWIVNIHRMNLMRFPLSGYPRLMSWYEAMRERRSYQSALTRYEPRSLRWAMRAYTLIRNSAGSGVGYW